MAQVFFLNIKVLLPSTSLLFTVGHGLLQDVVSVLLVELLEPDARDLVHREGHSDAELVLARVVGGQQLGRPDAVVVDAEDLIKCGP